MRHLTMEPPTPPGPAALVPASHVSVDGVVFAAARHGADTRVIVRADPSSPVLADFEGDTAGDGASVQLTGPASRRNAAALRRHLSWLAPRPLGLRTSFGFGDRLGLATEGHVKALRATAPAIAPIFAQQSIREMSRTRRTPEDVLDAATWGAFLAGWREPVGADADHLKTTADLDACAAAGFSLFTIDPGEHVDPRAETADAPALRQLYDLLPWSSLEDDGEAARARYAGRTVELDAGAVAVDEAALVRAAVKYGRAVAHVSAMYRHLAAIRPAGTFELEVSVDETDAPTSAAEHVYVASELRRLGVHWVSLAPRFVGSFEKGVDYIGDVAAFAADVAVHAAIARRFGPYKVSLHSGSDKFSIYPAVAVATRGLAHVKTAGTSYLEALRTVALLDPALLREIYGFARARYKDDRASYHVSASLEAAPAPGDVTDASALALLDQFDAREILHVTFGSVLTTADADGRSRFATRVRALLESSPDTYARCLERHFARHLAPFAG